MQTTKNLVIPPGNFGLPFVGETLNFLRERNFAEKRHAKYGTIFRTRLFGNPTVFIMGAEANRFLLTNENKYFVATWPKSIQMLLGSTSLSLQTGDFHASRRKLMYHAFQPRALVSYIPTMEAITTQYLEKWEQTKILTWYPDLRNYTLDIACKLLIGIDNGSKNQLGEFFEDWCAGLFTIPIPLPGTRFAKALRCRKELLKEIEQIILQRQQSGNLGEDALGILLQATDEAGNRLSLDELKDQILLLLFAGHETLTSALASFCLLIAQYPEILTRIRTEQEQFDLSQRLTLDTLKQMTYLEQVLKEVLRYISPVGGGFREVIQDCEFKGYLLPKGWSVQYNITRTHEDNHLYPNADRFDPDRFSSERAEDKQHFAYVPFGGGIRECLGKEFARLEMKVFATQLVRDYNWQLLPHQDLTLITIPTPHPVDGLKVDFQRK